MADSSDPFASVGTFDPKAAAPPPADAGPQASPLDLIFAPMMSATADAHYARQGVEGAGGVNDEQLKFWKRIWNGEVKFPDSRLPVEASAEFERDRMTAQLSFGFSADERSTFILTFLGCESFKKYLDARVAAVEALIAKKTAEREKKAAEMNLAARRSAEKVTVVRTRGHGLSFKHSAPPPEALAAAAKVAAEKAGGGEAAAAAAPTAAEEARQKVLQAQQDERQAELKKLDEEIAELERSKEAAALPKPHELFLTTEEFRACWLNARGFDVADSTVQQVKAVFELAMRKEKLAKQRQEAAQKGSRAFRRMSTMFGASFEASLEGSFDSAEGVPATASIVDPALAEERIINLLKFARACTLDRTSTASMPFPLAYATMQRTKYKDATNILYYLPFLVLFTFYFSFGRELTTGYWLQRAHFDQQQDTLFALACNGDGCGSQAVKTMTYWEVHNRTTLHRWLETRVIPSLWVGGDDEPATATISNHINPVGALRIRQVRVRGNRRDWQYERYVSETKGDDRGPSATDQRLVDAYLSRASGGYALSYPDSNAVLTGMFVKYTERAAEINALDVPDYVKNAFNYTSCKQKNAPRVFMQGDVGTYPCGGHELQLSYNLTKQEAVDALRTLEGLDWIDHQTRGVFVHQVLFNKDAKLFSRSIVGYEITSGGWYKPIRRSWIFNFFAWRAQSVAWWIFFIVFLLFIIFYSVSYCFVLRKRVARQAAALGRPFGEGMGGLSTVTIFFRATFESMMNDKFLIIDPINYALLIGVWIGRIVVWSKTATEFAYNVEKYPSTLDEYSYSAYVLDMFDGVNALILYLKLFKYFRVFRVLDNILSTITRSAIPMLGILATGIVLLISFAIAGYIAYGGLILEFSKVELSFITLLRFAVGDYEYSTWEEARRVVSPIYLALLQIFLVAILLNAITAVLADTFADVARDEFNAEKVMSIIRSDPTCMITVGMIPPLSSIPIIQEIRSWWRKPAVYLMHKRDDAMVKQKYSKTVRIVHHMEADVLFFWEHTGKLLYDAYYGTAHLVGSAATETTLGKSEEALATLWETIGQAQSLGVTTSDTDQDVTRSLTFTAFTIGGSAAERSVSTSSTLRSYLQSQFPADLEFEIALWVYLPKVALGLSRSVSLLDLVESRFNWTKQLQGTGEEDEDTGDELDQDAFCRTARSTKKLLRTMEQQEAENSASESSEDDGDDAAGGDKKDDDKGDDAAEAFHESAEQTHRRMLQLRAAFSGMRLQEIRELFSLEPVGDDAAAAPPVASPTAWKSTKEIAIDRLQKYKTKWKARHEEWRAEEGSPPVYGNGDDEVEAVFEELKHVLLQGEGESDKKLPQSVVDSLVQGYSEQFSSFPWLLVNEASLEPLKEWTRFVAYSSEWSAGTKTNFERELSATLAARSTVKLDKEQRKLLEDTPEEDGKVDFDTFCKLWKKATGARIRGDKERYIRESVDALDSEGRVDTEEFLKVCQLTTNSHSYRSFWHDYYLGERHSFRNTLQFMFFVPFLCLLTYLALMQHSGERSYSALSVKDTTTDVFRTPELRPFKKIVTGRHWHSWIESNILEKFLSVDGGFPSLASDGMNLLVGGIEVRQQRGQPVARCGFPVNISSLALDDEFYGRRVQAHFPSTCIPRWWIAQQSTAKMYVSPYVDARGRDAFKYQRCVSGATLYGEIGYYGCDGFKLFIPANLPVNDAKGLLLSVLNGSWIDRQTRAVQVDMFTYNFNNNNFVRSQFLFEVTAGGTWRPHIKQDTFQVFTGAMFGAWHFVLMSFFLIILAVMMVTFTISLVNDVLLRRRRRGTTVFRALVGHLADNKWVLFDMTTYILFIVAWVLRFISFGLKVDVELYKADRFPTDLITQSDLHFALAMIDCFTGLVSFAKTFYYFRMVPSMNILVNTLDKAANTMFAVLVLSFVILTAFALAGHLVLGRGAYSLYSVGKAYETLVLTFFGDDDYETWFQLDPVFAAIFYALFMIVAVQLMFNMIVSVLANAYGDAKEEWFDPNVLNRTLEVDATMVEREEKNTFLQFQVFAELHTFYHRIRLALKMPNAADYKNGENHVDYVSQYRAISKQRYGLTLTNKRKFFKQMHTLTAAIELGSPKQSGLAATDMLMTWKLIDENNRERIKKFELWSDFQKEDRESAKVFGIRRPRVLTYAQEKMNADLGESILFWCADMPARALGTTLGVQVTNLMPYNHVWRRIAKNYLKEDDGDDWGSKLSGYVTKVQTYAKNLGAKKADDDSGVAAAPNPEEGGLSRVASAAQLQPANTRSRSTGVTARK